MEKFTNKTGKQVHWNPEDLGTRLDIDADIGQMIHLSYYLPVYRKSLPDGDREERPGDSGLERDVRNKYLTVTGEAEDQKVHQTTVLDHDSELRQDVAVMIALLIASGIGNHPELVDTLAWNDAYEDDDDAVNERIEEVRESLRGWFVYRATGDGSVRWTTHEVWATLYLQEVAEAYDEARTKWEAGAQRESQRPRNRFRECAEELLTLVDDPGRRKQHAAEYRASKMVPDIVDSPVEIAEKWWVRLLKMGIRRPALAPVYDLGSDRELPVPAAFGAQTVRKIETLKGHIYLSADKYPEAQEKYQLVRDISEMIDDRQGVANSLGNLGLVTQSQGDYDDARDYFEQSLKLQRQLGSRQGIADCLNNLGIVAGEQGNHDKARDYFEQSLQLKQDLGDRQGIAASLGTIGLVAKSKGDYDDARHYFKQSLTLERELNNRQGIAVCLKNLGAVAKSQGEYNDAHDYFEQSLQLKRDLGDRQGAADSLYNLGLVANKQNDRHSVRESK